MPDRIGQYKIRRVIASGGMGTVYEGLQEQPRRPVAVKVMKQGVTSRSALHRFEYESQVLARLHHPCIAQIYEAGTHQEGAESVPFFAMEYIPNARSLTQYANEKKLPTRERLELFAKVCDAVHHGHQKGIIHRDLKPSNILVDSQGQPRIIDFGVARATDSDMAQPTIQTSVGQLVGSLQYMSPEQCDADPHDIDTRSDVYSLGVNLYELLVGKVPYDVRATPIHEAARIIREENAPRVGQTNSTLRGDLETITGKALQKDRARRYESASALAQDIRHFLSGEQISARPPTLTYQLAVFARRNRMLLAGVASVFVILIAALLVSTTLYFDAAEQRERAEKQSAKSLAAVNFLQEMLSETAPSSYGVEPTIADLLEHSSRTLPSAFPDDPEVEANIHRTLAKGYLNLGNWEKMETHLASALAIRKRVYGEEDPAILEVLNDLDNFYYIVGRHGDQEKVCRARVDIQTRTLGADHPDTLESKYYLAELLISTNQPGKARSLVTSVLEERRRAHGDRHADTVQSRLQLGRLLFAESDLAAAEALNREVLGVLEKDLGPDHRTTRFARTQLATTLLAQAKVEEAKSLYHEVAIPEDMGIELWFQGKEATTGAEDTQMLVFWETWCPFSQRLMPELENVYREHGDENFRLLALTKVDRSSTDQKVRDFIKVGGMSYPFAKIDGTFSATLKTRGTPWVVLIRDGALVWEGDVDIPEQLTERIFTGLMRPVGGPR